MKRIILIFICMFMTLGLLAEVALLSRSQLQATIEAPPGTQFLGCNKAPGRFSGSQNFTGLRLGSRIAKMDAYDFDWDEEHAVAIVNDTTRALVGKYCAIQRNDVGRWCLANFFGLFEIPIDIDPATGDVIIRAGVPLDSIKPFVNSEKAYVLYAMPLTWLEGSDEYGDIRGQVYGDLVSFSVDFGFLVYESLSERIGISANAGWGLSPIFKNLTLYKPNGIHTCVGNDNNNGEYVDIEPNRPDDSESGHGGVVTRPIKPRPGGETKPVRPRSFGPNNGSTLLGCRDVGNAFSQSLSAGGNSSSRYEVYMYQLDDTTVMVYNLFGEDYCWNYLYRYADGSVRIPAQVICLNNNDEPLYNCSNGDLEADSLTWGNDGSFYAKWIIWDDTYLCSDDGIVGGHFINNRIVLSNNAPDEPDSVCAVPEGLAVVPGFNSAVVTWNDANSVLMWNLRYRFASEDGNAPWTCADQLALPRYTIEGLESAMPYEVQVQAVNSCYLVSDWTEITSFMTLSMNRLGDVNKDGHVTIDDVTALIDALLDNRLMVDCDTFSLHNADVDEDGEININDVTTLIDKLLGVGSD